MTASSVGKPLDRVDGRLKVTGTATFSAEVAVANVAHAVIVGATISKGKITALDVGEAQRVPGVVAVLTHLNAAKVPGADKPTEMTDKVVQVLQNDAVLYDGQPIALVVADTLEHASHAASLVKATYAAEAAICEMDKEIGAGFAPKAAPGRPPPDSNRGDIDAALATAFARVDATYTTPCENHNPLEMHATIAVFQGEDHLTLYDATQGIFGLRKRISKAFDLKPENVRVISHFVGGGFGSKGSAWSHVFLAAMASRATGRAVKLSITRQQMFAFVGYRPQTIQQVTAAASKDGTLVALRHEVTSATSRFDTFAEPSANVTRMLYACPNVKTSHRLVRLDVATPTFTRAPGEASGSFALESALDELSYSLKMDPLALRLKNYAETDPDEKKPFSSKTLRDCYTQGAAKFGWSKRKPEPRSMRDGNWLVGFGMATATYPSRQSAASALARVKKDGSAQVLAGSQDIGTGTYTIMTQIAADALGMSVERVHFDLGDTTFPETPVSGGSQTASSVGSAVKRAGMAVRTKLIDLAVKGKGGPLNGMSAEQVDAEAGVLVSKQDRTKSDSYEAVLARNGLDQIEEKIDEKEKAERKDHSTHAFGAHFIEVKVDPDFGEVRVSRVVSAFAAGKILNRKTARSQFIGGIVWGLGLALHEHTERDPRTSRVVTKDLADYHVPVHADVPDMDIVMVDEVDPYVNEIGAKGVGEIGIVGVGAAIANAVYHATGKRVRSLPITLDKLL